MKTRKLCQAFALTLLVSACPIPGACKANEDCPQEGAVCFHSDNAKPNEDGICAYLISVGSPMEGSTYASLAEVKGSTLKDMTKVALCLEGQSGAACNSCKVENQAFSCALASLDNGAHTIVVRGDAGGKDSASVKVHFRIDAPPVPCQVVHDDDCSPDAFCLRDDPTVPANEGICIPPGQPIPCKEGNDVTCLPNTICYGGIDAKPGDNGICVAEDILFGAPYVPCSKGCPPGSVCYSSPKDTCGNDEKCVPKGPGQTEGTCEKIRREGVACMGGQTACGMACCDDATQVCEAGVCVSTATVSTFAGSGSANFLNATGTAAQFNFPEGIAIDSAGNLYVTDHGNDCIRRIDAETRMVTTFAGRCDGWDDSIGVDAWFFDPTGITMDTAGNLYVAEHFVSRIHKVTPQGVVILFAGSDVTSWRDGTGTTARFNNPWGITIDNRTGNLYVADTENHRIRRVTPAGVVSTFAGSGPIGKGNGDFADGNALTVARFKSPYGITVDSAGNLYVADSDNNRIRKVTPEGVVSTLAGDGVAEFRDGAGSAARFYHPRGIAADAMGNLYVADTYNHRIRKVTPTGVVTTFAGSGRCGSLNGTRTAAQFCNPNGIAIDSKGNLYVADSTNHRIRKITLE
ncbi:MAG: NHL repeat-containing protein [Cystobacterineae bacterium]|nr:NHL repeat-containing protein [Cystobacterineae bacterium]